MMHFPANKQFKASFLRSLGIFVSCYDERGMRTECVVLWRELEDRDKQRVREHLSKEYSEDEDNESE